LTVSLAPKRVTITRGAKELDNAGIAFPFRSTMTFSIFGAPILEVFTSITTVGGAEAVAMGSRFLKASLKLNLYSRGGKASPKRRPSSAVSIMVHVSAAPAPIALSTAARTRFGSWLVDHSSLAIFLRAATEGWHPATPAAGTGALVDAPPLLGGFPAGDCVADTLPTERMELRIMPNAVVDFIGPHADRAALFRLCGASKRGFGRGV
jgi:hypothetical protein